MEKFDEHFLPATQAVAPEFFQLPVAGGNAKFRERVYCYELYHQLRKNWPPKPAYVLNGEVNKQGHPIFAERGIKGGMPDFLVHKAGQWDNYAIIEVKALGASKKAIKKDLKKLCEYTQRADYRRALYLFYGYDGAEQTIKRVQQAYAALETNAVVELWMHTEPGKPAHLVRKLPSND